MSQSIRERSQAGLEDTSALFTFADDETRADDDCVFELESLDDVFDLALHLGVSEHGACAGPRATDEHVRLCPRFFGSLCDLEVHLVFDLVLVLEAAHCRSSRAQCVKDGRWGRRECGNVLAPFGGVFFKHLVHGDDTRLGRGWE